MQEDICKLNEDVNELLKQNDIQEVFVGTLEYFFTEVDKERR